MFVLSLRAYANKIIYQYNIQHGGLVFFVCGCLMVVKVVVTMVVMKLDERLQVIEFAVIFELKLQYLLQITFDRI